VSLKSIDISNITDTSTESWFQNCTNLKKIIGIEKISILNNWTFNLCEKLETIDLSLCKTICRNVFTGCINLHTVILKQIEIIDYRAFFGCSSLNKIDIPGTLTSIGSESFNRDVDNGNTKYFIFRSIVPPSLTHIQSFSHTDNCPFYVPDDSVSAYKIATNWNYFSDRIKPISQFKIDFPEG
jgi:hypothetical protein